MARPDTAPAGGGLMRTRGHDRAVASVRAMVAGRVPHALLLSGPAGIGKTTLAMDLAAGLMCDAPDAAARPCRACRGCRLVEHGNHSDLYRLAPTGPGDQIKIGDRDRPADGTVRRLAAQLVLHAVEGGWRVAIFERADRLTEDAQSALLKLLEEPPSGVAIVLCADDEDRLLPTVRSRTARIRLGPVATREIEEFLGEAGIADPPLAARLARIAGGRPGTARTLALAPEALAARDEIQRGLLDLLGASPAIRLAAARDLTARATDLLRAVDRVVAAGSAAGDAGPDAAPRRGRAKAARRDGPVPGPASAGGTAGTAADTSPDPDGETGDEDDESAVEAGASRATASAAERRRAAGTVIGLWRDVSRDLRLVQLGADRQVRDPALLDDLRAAAVSLGSSTGVDAAVGAFLVRLDAAGELLEANVRPEIILDTLLLHWPRAALPAAVAS